MVKRALQKESVGEFIAGEDRAFSIEPSPARSCFIGLPEKIEMNAGLAKRRAIPHSQRSLSN